MARIHRLNRAVDEQVESSLAAYELTDCEKLWRETDIAVAGALDNARIWSLYTGIVRGMAFVSAMGLTAIFIGKASLLPKASPSNREIITIFFPFLSLFIGICWVYIEVISSRILSRFDWMIKLRDQYVAFESNYLTNLNIDYVKQVGGQGVNLPDQKLSVKTGAPMAEWWPDFVAELVAYIVENGVPDGVAHQGQSEVIREVCSRLAERGKPEPSRTQIQETVNAMLRRMRLAGNEKRTVSG